MTDGSAPPAEALGLPLRLKLPIGGYDGRGQIRIADVGRARRRLGAPRRRQPGAAAARRARARRSRRSCRSSSRAAPTASPGLPDRPEPARRRDPGRVGVRRPGLRSTVAGRAAVDRHVAWPWRWTCRDADRGALPAARRTRSSSTSWRRASTTPATGRSRAPRPPSSSSTSGRSAASGSGRPARIAPGGDGQPARDGSAPRGPPARRRRGARRSRPSTSTSTTSGGLRTSQDGPPHGARAPTSRRRWRRARDARAALRLGRRPTTEDAR